MYINNPNKKANQQGNSYYIHQELERAFVDAAHSENVKTIMAIKPQKPRLCTVSEGRTCVTDVGCAELKCGFGAFQSHLTPVRHSL